VLIEIPYFSTVLRKNTERVGTIRCGKDELGDKNELGDKR
jgi:hypothetical protein